MKYISVLFYLFKFCFIQQEREYIVIRTVYIKHVRLFNALICYLNFSYHIQLCSCMHSVEYYVLAVILDA